MKIRKAATSGTDKVDLQMTPMIDIVFQLLIFFVMTFKIASVEGDFNVKMPLASSTSAAQTETVAVPVRLVADPQGQLTSIRMGDRNLGTDFRALRQEIIAMVGTDTGPGSMAENTEVELDCDYQLNYAYTIRAIDAVSGFIDQTGKMQPLIEKVKFAPPDR